MISNRADAAGLQRARDAGIETLVPAARATIPTATPTIARSPTRSCARDVDLVCLAGFMRLVGAPLLDAFPDRILNIHPSLLPAFPGLDAQRQALEHGVRVTGATVHLVTAELDGGPIVLQAAVPVLDDDTVETLSARILVEEHRIYPEAIRLVLDGGWSIAGRRFVRVGGVMSAGARTTRDLSRRSPTVAVPRRQEMMATLVAAVPFAADEPVKILELGVGRRAPRRGAADAFPARDVDRPRWLGVDARARPRQRLALFGDRARVARLRRSPRSTGGIGCSAST